MALLEDVSAFFPATIRAIHVEPVRVKFVHALAKVWYNFDACAKSRRVKTWARLMRDISTTTWVIVKATRQFVEEEIVPF